MRKYDFFQPIIIQALVEEDQEQNVIIDASRIPILKTRSRSNRIATTASATRRFVLHFAFLGSN